MCRRVTCSKCGRPDWVGCGAHIEQVSATSERSAASAARRWPIRLKTPPPATFTPAAKPAPSSSWMKRLFGRLNLLPIVSNAA
jgi:hypothetical protein